MSTPTVAPRSPPSSRPGPRTRGATSSGPSSELPQEAEVAGPQVADVRQLVAQDRHPLQPPAEREARHLLRVVADEAEDVRVDHPGAADLDPAGVLAQRATRPVTLEARDRDLERRLGEREEIGREARTAVLAEERAQQLQERALQVGEG